MEIKDSKIIVIGGAGLIGSHILVELILDLTQCGLEIQYEPVGLTFVTNRIGSIEKAGRELGFKANVELREGLISVIRWRNERPDTRVYPV